MNEESTKSNHESLFIDINIFNEINNLLGKSLNVEIVELEKYDSEAIKSLFMNGYLFRVSEKLIISKDFNYSFRKSFVF